MALYSIQETVRTVRSANPNLHRERPMPSAAQTERTVRTVCASELTVRSIIYINIYYNLFSAHTPKTVHLFVCSALIEKKQNRYSLEISESL